MYNFRSVPCVLFKTDFVLGQTHLHLLSSYDCACKLIIDNNLVVHGLSY